MKNHLVLSLLAFFLSLFITGNTCSMYKITKNGKTIVGNNEDWFSPNSQFWFEAGETDQYGVMYMGLLDKFAQGAINEAGLVFDGFANPELPIENTEGKEKVYIGDAIRKIMQTMSKVEEVKIYLEQINLSSLSSSQVVFVDKTGTYLIVEGDELIIGDEEEKAFSNFYYSQIESVDDVELEHFQKGLTFLKSSKGEASIDYCGQVMQGFSSQGLFGSTQYSTIYDLNALKIRIYLFHDYSEFIEIDLLKELKKGDFTVMMADLFPKISIGHQHYEKYNDESHPIRFLDEIVSSSKELSKEEIREMDFNSIINSIGYEWLKDKNNATAAIQIFEYGTKLRPNDADLFDSLGEAYFVGNDWGNSIHNYNISLKLDPDNENAVKMIAKANDKKANKDN